jgi:hypothetical protein
MTLNFRITDRFEDNAEPDEQRFFYLMGFAISRWAHVDRELFRYYRFAIGGNQKAVALTFYDNKTIGSHLAMVDALLKISLPNLLWDQWEGIYKEIRALLPIRNALAHDPVSAVISVAVQLSKDRTASTTRELSISHRSEKDALNPKRDSSKPITETELLAHIHRVIALENKMYAFNRVLPKRPSRQRAKSPQPKAAPRSIPKKTPKSPHGSAKPRPPASIAASEIDSAHIRKNRAK